MPILSSIAWLLLGLSAASLIFWLVALWRIGRMVRDEPTIRRGLDLQAEAGVSRGPEDEPSVSIVIPVHNEQRVIEDCAASLRGQDYGNLQIIFVLDRCTDQSRSILLRHAAEDSRITLVEIEACPEDWAGKCNAARVGAERATGDWLLFTDADTKFDPRLVRAAVCLARERGLGLLSLLSTLTYRRRFERIVQPVAIMNLIRMYPIERVNRSDPDRARPFANGQFMLFDRHWYGRIGGHEAVKDDLLEDIAFARRLAEHGGRGGLFIADGMLTCSMYDSLEAMKTGWKRIFIEACKRKPRRLRKNAWRAVWIGMIIPAIHLVAVSFGAVMAFQFNFALGMSLVAISLAGTGAHLLSLLRIYGLCGAPRVATILHPAGCWVVASVMFDAARDLKNRRPIVWAGREYVLEPRY